MLRFALISIAVVLTLIACSATDTQLERYAERFTAPAIAITAEQLYRKYKQAPDTSEDNYAGRRLTVTGTIEEITDDSDFEPTVHFDICDADDRFCSDYLIAEFSESRRAVVESWRPKQEITVTCYVPPVEDGFSLYVVVELRICQPH